MQIGLTKALAEGLGYQCAINLISEADPDRLEAILWTDKPAPALETHAISGVGSKRDVTRTMLGLLHGAAPNPQDSVALPDKAPYGQIIVDTETCTMCQACVGACPVNAIGDNPDKPQLSFTEAACVQCGLCRTTCPEGAISLEPRYNFAASALSPTVLNEEEPFACISCGKDFGTKSTIEKITKQLAGKHTMFAEPDAARLIQMCDNCRIEHQANSNNDPFTAGERPRIRRTEDYIEAERKSNTGEPLSADDFLMDDE
jgi:ferredoxin